MKYIYLLSIGVLFSFNGFCQSKTSYDQFEVYKQDKNNKILIIPFENKMYASSMDAEISRRNQLDYYEVKEELKKGIAEQILLSIGNKIPAVSMIHHRDTSHDILNYVYNSIGFKYDIIKSKDTIEEPKTKSELIKDRLNKFVQQANEDVRHEKSNYQRGVISNGEIHTTQHNSQRFMNVTIHNPNLLDDLSRTFRTNYYIFINEFHIGQAFAKQGSPYEKFRQISVHYTVFNQKGKEVDAGVSITEMPEKISELRKIEKEYLSIIANEISSFVPSANLDKATIKKEADDSRKTDNQRKVIHGLMVE
tara:strand:+ start:6308 stop:7228 length:921 start_codon:yes stop_codon:yes gene_type:complete